MLELPQECNTCQETRTTRGTKRLFLKSVSVWINKPHVVNRRLCGSRVEQICRCQTEIEVEKILSESRKQEESLGDERAKQEWESRPSSKDVDLSKEESPYTVVFRELVPKSEFFPQLREAVLYDKDKATVTFLPVHQRPVENALSTTSTRELPYRIKFKEIDNDFPSWAQVNEIILSWSCSHMQLSASPRSQLSHQWLRSVLLGKLVSWSEVNDISTSATSLQLVPVDKYKEIYVRLKNAYGKDLVKNWTERTDPKKFVYEDVAIAAYLSLIWEEDRQKKGLTEKQSFVDLGCGNGLLVYILTKEGHRGLGIDLRKRNIWDTFGPGVDLKEKCITPSSEHLFPGYDWLIGNHSDELTPWIPVIAARSSPECSFFVLPCCHHDFVGKFGDVKKGQSRYGTYVDYVKTIVEYCGFQAEVDTLRIPSTKRICLIGRERTYRPEDEAAADTRRQAFIDKRTLLSQHKTVRLGSVRGDTSWIPGSQSSQGSSADSGSFLSDSLSQVCEAEEDTLDIDLAENKKNSQVIAARSLSSEESKSPCDDDYDSLGLTFEGSQLRRKRKIELPLVGAGGKESCQGISSSARIASGSQKMKKWAKDFQPRVEPGVRNCHTVPEETKSKIVNRVFDLVLNSDLEEKVKLKDGRQWNKGGLLQWRQCEGEDFTQACCNGDDAQDMTSPGLLQWRQCEGEDFTQACAMEMMRRV
ncbi:catenin (cadherin-associated protein), alpha 3 [Plakobranchus ocellatus]|uniref:tRNA (uracil-O(2)-)-methyltransferase n=1 Tax=Plakobranchus ocellatus TaxID=259542 RepID=A0AAV4DQQ5_9GAST|nr:catenin (cadherin-associated protein), alpha 3 [Plakobranchus ocellatus]